MSDELIRTYIESDIKNLTGKELGRVYKYIRGIISGQERPELTAANKRIAELEAGNKAAHDVIVRHQNQFIELEQARRKIVELEAKAGKVCEWTQCDMDDCGVYETACGNIFQFIDGTPSENKAKFCQYCGGTIAALSAMGVRGE